MRYKFVFSVLWCVAFLFLFFQCKYSTESTNHVLSIDSLLIRFNEFVSGYGSIKVFENDTVYIEESLGRVLIKKSDTIISLENILGHGPDQIPTIDASYIHSSDSIILLSNKAMKALLVSAKNHIYSYQQIDLNFLRDLGLILATYPQVYYQNHQLYITVKRDSYSQQEIYSESPLFTCVNILDSVFFVRNLGSYPDKFKRNEYATLAHFSFDVYNEQTFLVSFIGEDTIYQVDKIDGAMDVFAVPASPNLNQFILPFRSFPKEDEPG